ncbi:enoyl-CoA hydratase/isomerase family protein [Oceanobacillus alkalisoli]|uniref:enoyl-CoA hydratase/isomerase family protein n=1 Tax=Oceanobacillus alkalisoli TaxID=2925113 RepID=UPI001EF1326B|nr:enoyl-CoA hydratase/isomerase family protein [Oceanobacillus alkalisoli]MCF3942531.1 enoyl-CoA hydratase-related protein [Oceanobacillus alkalisoli]MCG5103588.1 enoyl-CoA hydratase-related protein [Oceanobacillus alkalisoli]
MGEVVNYEKKIEGYGIIRLNRPEKQNAISLHMGDQLQAKLAAAEADDLNFLLLTGVENRMFSAGGDLNELHGELSTNEAFAKLKTMMEVLQKIVNFPVPVIALLNGDALGGGCELATACDIRIAKANTKFGFIQTTIGILPGWGGGALLYKKVQPDFALDWIATGAVLTAHELKEKGWLHDIIDSADWKARRYLEKYIARSVEQMRLLKEQFKVNMHVAELPSLMKVEVKNAASLWESETHKQAIENFSKKK